MIVDLVESGRSRGSGFKHHIASLDVLKTKSKLSSCWSFIAVLSQFQIVNRNCAMTQKSHRLDIWFNFYDIIRQFTTISILWSIMVTKWHEPTHDVLIMHVLSYTWQCNVVNCHIHFLFSIEIWNDVWFI
jgi:hypothetical protein